MNVRETLCAIVGREKFRGTLRWLHHSNPELWAEVMQLTAFLPDTASASQRVWHVVHQMYSTPVCNITNNNLKWADFERGYCVTASRSAKAMMQHQRGDFDNCYTDEINQKRSASNKKAHADGRIVREPWSEEMKKIVLEKSRATCLERYGVDNYRKSEEARQLAARLVYERHLAAGGLPREQRDARRQYYDAVAYHTNENWVNHFERINPTRIERGPQHHLDHIYSRAEGYKNGVDPQIIGHWTNLRILPLKSNSAKRDRCDKTLEQLIEDYQRAINKYEQACQILT